MTHSQRPRQRAWPTRARRPASESRRERGRGGRPLAPFSERRSRAAGAGFSSAPRASMNRAGLDRDSRILPVRSAKLKPEAARRSRVRGLRKGATTKIGLAEPSPGQLRRLSTFCGSRRDFVSTTMDAASSSGPVSLMTASAIVPLAARPSWDSRFSRQPAGSRFRSDLAASSDDVA